MLSPCLPRVPRQRAALDLYDSYYMAIEASHKDDKVDANKDGVADVKQMAAKELLTHKLKVRGTRSLYA